MTGSITLETTGATTTLTAGAIAVDTTTIASDKSMRDNRLRTEGLQTDTFKTAGFKLTSPSRSRGRAGRDHHRYHPER